MKIILPTTGKYFWELTPFFRLFNKFWGEDQEVIILTERDPELPFKNAKFARMDAEFLVDGIWTNDYYTAGIKWYLREHVDDSLWIQTQTDQWLRTPVDRKVVQATCDYMNKHDEVIRTGLTSTMWAHAHANMELKGEQGGVEFHRCKTPGCFSVMSNLVAVWNVKNLCDVWGNYGGWAAELHGANTLMKSFPHLESLLTRPVAFEVFGAAGTRNKHVDARLIPAGLEHDVLPFVPADFTVTR